MASIEGYNVYAGGWKGWRAPTDDNPFTNYNNVGPSGGNYYRTAIKITLDKIADIYQRDKLDLSVTLYTSSSNLYTPDTEKLVAAVTTIFDGDGAAPDSPTTSSTIYPSVVEDVNYTVNWSLDISKISKEKTTIYVYVYSALANVASTGYCTSKIKAVNVNDSNVQILSNPTTGSIISGSTIYKPSTSVTAKWVACTAGINNTVNYINVYYNIGSIPTSSNPGTLLSSSVSATATSYTFTLPASVTRGSNIYIAIQAIGSVSGYNGSLNYAKIGTVNNLPDKPKVEADGNTVAGSTSVKFTITKGSDADSQSTSIYYKINGGNRQSLSGTELTISTSTTTSGIASGTNTIYFYTNDGLEDSSATTQTIEVIYAPVLNNASISYTKVNNGYNNSATLAKTGVISYVLARDVSNPTALFKIRTASSSSGLTGNYSDTTLSHSIDNTSKKITVDIMNSSNIPAGYYFQIQVAIQDSYGTSSYVALASGQKPALAVGVSSVSVATDGTSKAKSNYFNNNVTISFTNPSANVNRPDITSIKIYANSKEFSSTDITEGNSPSITLDLSTIGRNTAVSFSVVLTDTAGQSVTTNYGTSLTRTSEIKFEGSEWGINPTTFKPYTTTSDLVLSYPNATATGTDASNITYQYKIKVNNTEKALSSATTSATNFKTLINEIISESGRNTTYTATLTVTAVDGFNVSVQLPSQNITINYVEAPTFANSESIKIKHDFYTGTSSITTSTGTEVTSSLAQNNATRLFNPEEGVILMLPKATDYNNDISKYHVYISRNDLPTTSTVPITPANNSSIVYEESPWLSLSPSQLTVSDTNHYYYRHKASWYSKNQYYYFKLIVEDSKGNKTEARYSNTYIIGCRVVKPTFSTGAIKPTRSEDDSTITLNYNLTITDLGGSAPSTGWNKDYYAAYPNIKNLLLKIEIAPDSSFSTSVKTQTSSATTNLQNFTHSEAIFSGVESWSKIYMRFTIITTYNELSTATISSDSFIDAYVGNVPTVSHRSHWVGINTNNFQDNDEVFVVENYSGRDKVVLRGATKTILIDLKNGTINGIDFSSSGTLSGVTINCGSWS